MWLFWPKGYFAVVRELIQPRVSQISGKFHTWRQKVASADSISSKSREALLCSVECYMRSERVWGRLIDALQRLRQWGDLRPCVEGAVGVETENLLAKLSQSLAKLRIARRLSQNLLATGVARAILRYINAGPAICNNNCISSRIYRSLIYLSK